MSVEPGLAMSWEEWSRHDAVALATRVRGKQVTARELARQAARAVELLNPRLAAVLEVFEDVVRKPDADRPTKDGALYALPKILVLPWILLMFGLGMTPAVVYGVLQGFFPICLLVVGGVRDIDQTPLRVARSMGATPWQLYRKVVLPAMLPAVLAGMRLGIVFCLLGVLVVEMFGGIRGMGFLLVSLANAFRAPELFAATALVSVLSIAIVLGLERLNRRLGHWR